MEIFEQIQPYFVVFTAAYTMFLGWMFWKARWSKVPLDDGSEDVSNLYSDLLHNEAVAIERRGWLYRPESLVLKRKSINRIRTEPSEPLEMNGLINIAEGGKLKRTLASFDASISMSNSRGQDVRLLESVLSLDYLVPIDELKYCKEGMLPPVEFEIRKLIMDLIFKTMLFQKLTIADRLFNKAEKSIRSEEMLQTCNRLVDIIRRTPEDRAAFRRVRLEWLGLDGNSGVPGFLKVFDDVLAADEDTKPIQFVAKDQR